LKSETTPHQWGPHPASNSIKSVAIGYPNPMGRKKKFPERCTVTFEDGTLARVTELLEKLEDRTDFVRTAVENEIPNVPVNKIGRASR
jgi:hypothetical protein